MLEKIIFKLRNKAKKKYLFLLSFLLNLIILSIPLYIYSHYEIIPISILKDYTLFISYILNLSNVPNIVLNNIIIVNGFNFIIDQNCIGIKGILGFFAIIFAIPFIKYREKLNYFIKFSPILFLINIFRVYSTIILYYYLNLSYEEVKFLHDILWEILSTGIVILLWILFLRMKKLEIINYIS